MDQEREDVADADAADGDEPIEVAGGVAAAGRRLISEDWAATVLGLVLLRPAGRWAEVVSTSSRNPRS